MPEEDGATMPRPLSSPAPPPPGTIPGPLSPPPSRPEEPTRKQKRRMDCPSYSFQKLMLERDREQQDRLATQRLMIQSNLDVIATHEKTIAAHARSIASRDQDIAHQRQTMADLRAQCMQLLETRQEVLSHFEAEQLATSVLRDELDECRAEHRTALYFTPQRIQDVAPYRVFTANEDDASCVICNAAPFQVGVSCVRTLKCEHSFCPTCIDTWIQSTSNPRCPTCRAPIGGDHTTTAAAGAGAPSEQEVVIVIDD